MTIGIYALYWAEQDVVYVGKSQAIEHRWQDHRMAASRKDHTNYKVQKAYDQYGQPEYIILEVTTIDKLSTQEAFWTTELDALSDSVGLGIVAINDFSPINNLYSKKQILKVFSLLYKNLSTIDSISKRTKVNISTIKKIAVGKLHLWIKEKYPEKYILLNNRTSIPDSFAKGTIIKHIDGSEHKITSISSFCKQHPLLANSWNYNKSRISLVINGKLESFKGFYI